MTSQASKHEPETPGSEVTRPAGHRPRPAKTRLPLTRSPPLLRPAHRLREDLRHSQGHRQQQREQGARWNGKTSPSRWAGLNRW